MLSRELKKFLMTVETDSGMAFDLNAINSNLNNLKLKFPTAHFVFPVKSLPRKIALQHMIKVLHGFELGDLSEYAIVKDLLTSEHELWLNRFPLKQAQVFFDQRPKARIWLTVETPQQLAQGIELKKNYNFNLALRMNPAVFISTSLSRFGILEKDFDILKSAELASIDALHIHYSETKDQKTFDDVLTVMMRLKSKLPALKRINFGGGWDLANLDAQKCDIPLTIENGRSIIEPFGCAFARVEEIKHLPQGVMLETKLSPAAHIRWPSQKQKCFIFPFSQETQTFEGSAFLCGPTSFEGDMFELNIHKHFQVGVGDLLVLHPVSGYSVAWNHSFNGSPECDVRFLYEN